jgi:hypothetical protein
MHATCPSSPIFLLNKVKVKISLLQAMEAHRISKVKISLFQAVEAHRVARG